MDEMQALRERAEKAEADFVASTNLVAIKNLKIAQAKFLFEQLIDSREYRLYIGDGRFGQAVKDWLAGD